MQLEEVGPVGTRGAAILRGLDEQQRALVTAINGPVLGVAGPGAGKTRAMTHKAAYMIDQGIPAPSILMLTFTRAASSSMVQRARALSPEAAMISGGTFHHVAGNLLRDAHAAFGLPPNFTVLDPGDAEGAVADCIARLPFPAEGNRPRSRTIANVLSFQANTRCELGQAILRRAAGWIEHEEWFGRIQEMYVDYKVEKGLVDYDDLLIYFGALVNDPDYGPQIRARWPYVLVDEHQDSNPAQMDIIFGLGGDDGNITPIGDPSQSVYGFRGAEPRAMFSFCDRYPHARVINLETNYRSTGQIVMVVNAIDRAMRQRFERTLRSLPGRNGPRPGLVACRDDGHQAEEICARVLAQKEQGVPLHEQAILVRSTAAARAVEFELIAQRIPYRFVGGLKIDEAAHVKDLLSLARTVDNPMHELAWVRVLTLLDGVVDVGARKMLPTLTAADGPGGVLDALDRVKWPRKADPAPLREALAALLEPGCLSARISAAVAKLDGLLAERYKDDWHERRRDLDAVAGISDNYADLTDFLEALTIDYRMDSRQKVTGGGEDDERPLTLSTVHSSKGLEWEVIHIPGFSAGHFPSFAAYDDPEAMEEELRVFYVAASRAKRLLLFYRAIMSEKGQMREPSPYELIIRSLVDDLAPLVARGRNSIAIQADRVIDRRSLLLGRR